ncbi:MAG: Ig-like domain-containing protein, partial [Ignavibacteria bacterium]|nr:Ig-like domain-containing protein [Ignavibacteria bacterium]
MKKLIVLLALLSMSSTNAAYLSNVQQTLTQPNGNVIHCLTTGDEYYNYLHDSAGYTIIQNETTGYYVYADKIGDSLVPTNLIVGVNNPSSLCLAIGIKHPDEYIQQRYLEANYFNARNGNTLQATPTFTNINNIVVFVKWVEGVDFIVPIQHYIENFNTHICSMRNYYKEISFDKLDVTSFFCPPQQDIGNVVCVIVEHSRNYYLPYNAVSNPDGYPADEQYIRASALIAEVIDSVKKQNMIPTSLDIDNDGDGYIDGLTFIFQGGTGSGILWPHKSVFPIYLYYNSTINGKIPRDYYITVSSTAPSDTAPTGIGPVDKHEFGHILGAPDYYNSSNPNDFPVDRWSLMANNSFGSGQYMTMYERERFGGWIDVPQITNSGTYTINPVTSPTNNAYKIKSPNSDTQYIYLEYRKTQDEFAGDLSKFVSPTSGLLVYRIDKRYRGCNGGYEMYVYRPNGSYGNGYGSYNNGYGSGYIGSKDSALFTQNHIPNLTSTQLFLQDNTPSGIDISNITENPNGTITFTVDIGTTKYVASIQLSMQTLELLAGGKDATLEYTISPADATNKNVSWKSTNPSIATVSDGVVTPIAVGET